MDKIKYMKLLIYESFENGRIEDYEKDILLEKVKQYESEDKESFSENDFKKYSKKNFYKNIILSAKAMRNSHPDYKEKEIEKIEKMIAYAENHLESAPDKLNMKEIMKQSHKAGLRGAAYGAVAGSYGIDAALATQKHNIKTKNEWKYIIDGLKKNLEGIKAGSFKMKTITGKEKEF